MKILFATTNKNKVKEFASLASDLSVQIISLDSFSDYPDVVENGKTFAENALKKAREYALLSNLTTIAEDSGLVVDFLSGAPGIYSSRYAGKKKDYKANNAKLLCELKGVPPKKRAARFICNMAICDPCGKHDVVEGICEGRIILKELGSNGFGYDPIFLPAGFNKTMAEIPLNEKNKISHRGRAFKKLLKILPNYII